MRSEERNYWKRTMGRRWQRRRFLGTAGALGAGAAGFALVGCGDDDDDNGSTGNGGDATSTAGGGDQPSATEAADSGESKQGGTLVFGGRSEPIWGTAPYAFTATNTGLFYTISDTLFRYGSRDLDPQPRLAESYEFNGDESELVVKLKPGITFWDGTPITAQHVADNVAALGAQGTPNSQVKGPAAAYIETVEAVDDATARFVLKRPGTLVFDVFQFLSIVDPATVADAADGRAWNGAGPYKLTNIQPQQGAKLEAHKEHWAAPALDAIEYRVFPDPSGLALAVETGEVDLTYDLSADDSLRFKDDGGFQHFAAESGGSAYCFGMQTKGEVTGDPRIRLALHKSIDRQRIAEDVFLGIAAPRYQIWSETSLAYDPESSEDPFDLAAAKALVEEAGYADGTPPIEIIVRTSLTEAHRYLEIIQADAKQAGLNIEIAPNEDATFSERFLNSDYPGCYSTTFGFFDYHPDTLPVMNYQVRVPNAAGFDSPDYDALLKNLEAARTQDERNELYAEFNRIWREQMWVTLIADRRDQWIVSKNTKGFSLDGYGIPAFEALSRA